MAKYLTKDIYKKLERKRTSKGYTLDQSIQYGIDKPNSKVGIIAGDEECYELYKVLFDQVIEKLHQYKIENIHPVDMDFSKLENTEKLDQQFICGSKISCFRNIRGFRLTPAISRLERNVLENLIVKALKKVGDYWNGKYYHLDAIDNAERDELQKSALIFENAKRGSIFTKMESARDWPSGRGIYYNNERDTSVWVNDEEHISVVIAAYNKNIVQVFSHWLKFVNDIEESIKRSGYEFMYDIHRGFISICPSKLGTGIRASMHVRLSLPQKNFAKFKKICQRFLLESELLTADDGEVSEKI